MKTLHKIVIKSYLGPFVATFFVSMFVLLMQFLWKYIEDFVGKGLEWYVITEVLVYASASLVSMALPLAVLLASIMTFGNFGENSELLAMKSAGISLQKIMSPLIIIIVIISIAAFFFSNNVIPYTNLKMRALMWDIKHKNPELNLKPGAFNRDIEDYVIKIGDKNSEKSMLYDLIIYKHTSYRGNINVILADSAKMLMTEDEKYMILTLFHGYGYEESKEKNHRKRTYPHQRDVFNKKQIIIEMENTELRRSDEKLFKKSYKVMNISKLELAGDSIKKRMKRDQHRFYQDLGLRHYMRRGRKEGKYQDTAFVDSLITKEELHEIMDLNKYYEKQTTKKQIKYLDIAIEETKTISKKITHAEEEKYYETKTLSRHYIEWHRKFTLSFACFIFFFIGAPLGAIIRKGGFGMPVVISILFFIFYYVISLTGEKFAREDIMPTYYGMWVSSAVLLPLGVLLTYKATTDSSMLNINTYLAPIKRFFNKDLRIEYQKEHTKTDE